MYVVVKTILGKRKKTYWSDRDQDILETLVSQSPHLAPKELAKIYLEQNTFVLQPFGAIIKANG